MGSKLFFHNNSETLFGFFTLILSMTVPWNFPEATVCVDIIVLMANGMCVFLFKNVCFNF